MRARQKKDEGADETNGAQFSTPDVDNDNYCRPEKQKNGNDIYKKEEEVHCNNTNELRLISHRVQN